MDRKDTIEGSFLLGEYRYVFLKPETGRDGTLSDELVATEILDCTGNFFGTIKQIRRYKGKIVSQKLTAASDVTMIQTTMPNIGAKLCAASQGKKASLLEPRANPGYNRRPSEQDNDGIINKHAPKAKNTK